MKAEVLREFDGYEDVVRAIELSRIHGVDYTPDKDSPEPYIRRLHPPSLHLQIQDLFVETPSTKTFRLVSRDGPLPPFQAGQYISLVVDVGAVRTSRPYSISSPPNHLGHYDVTVRRYPDGLVSNHLLDHARKGDVLEATGPAGEFYHNPLFHSKHMVLIAGGCGITPFRSMIREILECGLDRTIHLFYGNRDAEDVIFHEEFLDLAARFDRFHYIPVLENPPPSYPGRTGLITGKLLREILGDLEDKTFYVCGPQGLYDFCIPELETLGIPRRKLRREVYGTPSDIRRSPGWPAGLDPDTPVAVKVNGGKPLATRAGEPLLACLERHRIAVPSSCRSGSCSLCRVKVLAGRVYQPPGALVRKSDRKHGYIHACVSYPLEDLHILM